MKEKSPKLHKLKYEKTTSICDKQKWPLYYHYVFLGGTVYYHFQVEYSPVDEGKLFLVGKSNQLLNNNGDEVGWELPFASHTDNYQARLMEKPLGERLLRECMFPYCQSIIPRITW